MNNSSAIKVINLSYHFKRIRAVDNLSLDIPRGVSFGLLGPNGSGKTTLIRLMAGLLKPKSGEIEMLGKPLTRQMSSSVGYMPQVYALYMELSVAQNVDFFGKIYGLRDRTKRNERVNEIIKRVNLWERRNDPVYNLSGGMRQRVSLACAMVHSPSVMFLDEPTVGLDPELRLAFWDYFNSLTKNGTTIIVSSHTMDDANRCDRLAFLRDGHIIAEGSPAELRQATGNPNNDLESAFLYFVKKGTAK